MSKNKIFASQLALKWCYAGLAAGPTGCTPLLSRPELLLLLQQAACCATHEKWALIFRAAEVLLGRWPLPSEVCRARGRAAHQPPRVQSQHVAAPTPSQALAPAGAAGWAARGAARPAAGPSPRGCSGAVRRDACAAQAAARRGPGAGAAAAAAAAAVVSNQHQRGGQPALGSDRPRQACQQRRQRRRCRRRRALDVAAVQPGVAGGAGLAQRALPLQQPLAVSRRRSLDATQAPTRGGGGGGAGAAGSAGGCSCASEAEVQAAAPPPQPPQPPTPTHRSASSAAACRAARCRPSCCSRYSRFRNLTGGGGACRHAARDSRTFNPARCASCLGC